MNRLSGQDALFLHLDRPHAASHGTVVYIYEPSTEPRRKVRFRDILRHIEKRLHIAPLFRRKIVRVAGDLGYPYWAEDQNFEINFHVRHSALPAPADWRQFCILAARIHSRPVDLSRPPWEMHVIEGLDNVEWLPKGSFAILTKLHHAAVDGTAVAELTWALHDRAGAKDKPVPVLTKPKAVAKTRAEPGFVESLTRIVMDNLSSAMQLAAPTARIMPKLGAAAARLLQQSLTPGDAVPRTRFNATVSSERVFASATFELADVKRIKDAVPGATVNDAVLAIVGGALRRYLLKKKELPQRTLAALAPVNTRRDAAEPQTAGNTISLITFPLRTDIADPLARLAAIHDATSQAKATSNAVGARELTDISKHAPPAMLAYAGRLAALTGLGGLGPVVLHNCGVSNVPGPDVPLFMLGAKLAYWSCVAPITDGLSPVFAVTSYCGKMIISPTSAPNIVPDPDFLIRCVRASFEEMKRAVPGPRTAGSGSAPLPRRRRPTRPKAA
jgi:WS/DGAT/MGAT family acyltransferase